MREINNYPEFWDYYVAEHSKPMTRYLHFAGTSLGILLLFYFIGQGMFSFIPLCFVVGYAFAWFSHFFIEKNKPATLKYPLWSFISDYKMMWLMIQGKMSGEVERVSKEWS